MGPHAEISPRSRRRGAPWNRPVTLILRGIIHGNDVRRRVVPGVLNDLLVRACGPQWLPRNVDKPFPGLGSGESLSKLDGSDHRFDVEVGRQIIGIDDGRIEWICAPEFDLSTCPKVMRVKQPDKQSDVHIREVGEIRLEAIVIQLPSGSENPGATHPFDQMNW